MEFEAVDVLAFGAHPDDVELGCGGTLARLVQQGYRIGIVDLTEGEMASRGTVAERKKEAAKAARILQARWRHNAGFPDGHIQNSRENQIKLIQIVRQCRPSLVFLPYPSDRHPDHVHASELVKEACFYAGLGKMAPGADPHRPRRLVFYPMTYQFTPSFIVDVSESFQTKVDALKAYRSQFFNPNWPGPETFVSSQWFMEAVEFRARHYGWLAGVKYGEPFWVREPLALADPFPILTVNRM